jgi:hypothetical protein
VCRTWAVTHTVGYDKNPIVRNAPQYTIPIDYEQRGEPLVYNRVDKDFAVSVVTPRQDRTVASVLVVRTSVCNQRCLF